MKKTDIVQYRDFWDLPRIFLVSFEQSLFLFDCKFNEEDEDFSDKYNVFLMPELKEHDLAGSWEQLPEKAIRFLGEIPVREVRFDKTRRKSIDGEVILNLLNRKAR